MYILRQQFCELKKILEVLLRFCNYSYNLFVVVKIMDVWYVLLIQWKLIKNNN